MANIAGGVAAITGQNIADVIATINGTNDQDDTGDDFDPIAFASQIMQTVEGYRSKSGPVSDQIVTSPLQTGAGTAGEDRLNCFYRLIGLPAVRADTLLALEGTEDFEKPEADQLYIRAVSQGGTLNLFKLSHLGLDQASTSQDLQKRSQLANRKQLPIDYQTMFTNPVAISESITGAAGRKPMATPPIVDATIPVFPLNRRVAPAFNDGDFIPLGSQTRLSRPFLEHIIYMRTKVFSGATTELVDQIKKNIIKETGKDNLAQHLPNEFTKIGAAIVRKFVQAFKKSSANYREASGKANELMAKVAFVAIPTSDSSQRSLIPISGSQDVGAEAIAGTELGDRIAQLNERMATQDSLIISLPIESINRSDRIRRIEDEIQISNIKDDVFISAFVEIISSERKKLQGELDQARQEEQGKIMELEQVKQELMLYTGEFVGLSIFDVLCVLYALFTIEMRFLLGLLNEDAKTRLKSDEFFKSNQSDPGSTSTTVAAVDLIGSSAKADESLAVLQSQIEAAFDLVESFIVSKNR